MFSEMKHELRIAQKNLQRQQNRQMPYEHEINNSQIYIDEINVLSDKMKESNYLLMQYRVGNRYGQILNRFVNLLLDA